MNKYILTLLACLLIFSLYSQDDKKQRAKESGELTLGMRTTVSAFNATEGMGLGYGGHFRLRLGRNVNTEWYADYIVSDISGLGSRRDGHIGWSVLFYWFDKPAKPNSLLPYFAAGHCFDYTNVQSNLFYDSHTDEYKTNSGERWSSAVHLGIGTHYYLAENFDISLKTQYMMHLGGDMHAHVHSHAGEQPHLEIEEHEHLSLEGHLLTTLSLNVRMADLWK